MNSQQFIDSLNLAAPPPELTAPAEALWWDAKADWARAHGLVDALESREGMVVHAYLHRKEGDESNAAYWYRRAGEQYRRVKLEEEWRALVTGLLG